MSSQEVALSEICDTGSGGTPSRAKQDTYYGGAIPWVKSGELRESVITETGESITDLGLSKSSAKLLPRHTLLVALYGATVGRVGMLGIEAATNQAVCFLIPDDTKVNRRYLYHALRSKVPYWLTQRVGGGQPNISQGVIKNTKIPLPPLSEQKRIAEILDRAEALRAKRRAALALLDELTQSIFLDMFGDPVSNPKGWQTTKFGELCSRVTVGIVVKPASYYVESGVPALRSLNVKRGKILMENLVFFSQHDNDVTLKKTKLKAGDLVLVRSGQPGTCAVVPQELEGVNAIDILIASPNQETANSTFLCEFFNSAGGRDLVMSKQRGQIQKHLNVGVLNNAWMPIPPLTLQREFESRVSATERLKSSVKDSLAELAQLFASLQHRAFRGEL